jgi:Flp pilus assembly pilin Flp
MIRSWTQRLLKDDRAASSVEYGLLAGLMVVLLIGAMTAMGGKTATHFNNVQESFEG